MSNRYITSSSSSYSRSVAGTSYPSAPDAHRGDLYNRHLWDAERRSHNIRVRQRNTKYGILLGLSALGAGLGTGALSKLGTAISNSKLGTAVAALFGKKASSDRSSSSADARAIAALNSVGANIGGSQSSRSSDSSLLNFFKGLFGSGSNSFNLSGLISGLTGIGTELGSSVLNYQNQVKLIDKQNEYNTPAAQMQRFADAGLNPNLIYGMGNNGNQPASGSIAPVDFSTASREAKMQMLNYKVDLAQKQAQINLLDKQANESDERAKAQNMANSTYFSTWYSEQMIRIQQARQIAQSISNDKTRVDIENRLADAEIALKKIQGETRSPLGQWGHDIINMMVQFNSFMDDTLGNLNEHVPDAIAHDGFTGNVPPHFNGR